MFRVFTQSASGADGPQRTFFAMSYLFSCGPPLTGGVRRQHKMIWKPVESPSKDEMAAFLKEHRKIARFLVDESVGVEVARQLKELGWNVKYIDDAGLEGHSDEDIYAYAHKERRVILTHDDHFMDNRIFPMTISPGVVKVPGGSGDEIALVQAVAQVISLFGKLGDFFENSKISITSAGIWTIFKFDRPSGRIEKRIYKFPRNGDALEWVES